MTDKDLKTLEREAFRKFYDDGLFDVFLGLMLALMPLASAVDGWLGMGWQATLALVAVYGVLVAGFTYGRHRLVRPRLGSFKPAPQRRRKITATRLALLASAVLGVIAWIAVVLVSGDARADLVNWIPLVFFVNATAVFGAMGYFLDVPRFYAYGPLFGLAVVLEIYSKTLLDTAIPLWLAFGGPGLAIITVGIVRLVRFLRDYPVRTNEVHPDAA